MLGRDGHMPSGRIVRHWVEGAAAELAASRKKEKNASIGSDYHRGRNLGPDEHVSLPTLCQSGKKDLNLRRRQGRSFSVPESFGAGATLQR